jgi:hypothetical protein
MRKLVTIRKVDSLKPIEGADNIELAIVDGWQCVVKKNTFTKGDNALYFEVDSFLPAKDERFKFLEKTFTLWNNHHGTRIKTIKLRGQISQGLLLPLSDFPEVRPHKWGSDADYSEILGIKKWERASEGNSVGQQKATWFGRKLKKLKHTKLKPMLLWLERKFPRWFLTNATRPFPSFIPKTDEERVQNLINKIGIGSDEMYERTVKLDGSSESVYFNAGRVGVCSRNLDLKRDPDNKYWATILDVGLEDALKKLKRNISIQGELMGPGIQGNREKLDSFHFYVFKIYDIDEQRYVSLTEKLNILRDLDECGCTLETVPGLGVDSLKNFTTIDYFLEFAEGPSLNKSVLREGVVFTTLDGKSSFKVIANSYLLKEAKEEQ